MPTPGNHEMGSHLVMLVSIKQEGDEGTWQEDEDGRNLHDL